MYNPKSNDDNLFLTSQSTSKHINPSHSHLIKYSLIVPKRTSALSNNHSQYSRNKNNIHNQTDDSSFHSNLLTDRNDFFCFPILPLNTSVEKDNESFNYNLTHPIKPINISHKINFNANPRLVKGNVLSNSITCCKSIIDKPLEIQQMRAPGFFGRNAYWMIKDDFNKVKEPDKKRFDILKHLTHRERRIAEIQSRKVFKYKEGKERMYKVKKERKAKGNGSKVRKAKDIIIERLPRIKGMGYQGYSTERKEGGEGMGNKEGNCKVRILKIEFGNLV